MSDVFVELDVVDLRLDQVRHALSSLIESSAMKVLSDASLALLVGGPGEGKSSITAMAAMMLRRQWITDKTNWEESFEQHYTRVEASLARCASELGVQVLLPVVPVRVSLPAFARVIARRKDTSLWHFLAADSNCNATFNDRLTYELADSLERDLRNAGDLAWILDGLDEVPHGAVRQNIVALIEQLSRSNDRVVVTTRPQGLEEKFSGFEQLVLQELRPERAQHFARKLVEAWTPPQSRERSEQLEKITEVLTREEVKALATTPLHTALIAIVSLSEALPKNRSHLLELFFETLFKRELSKRVVDGITLDDKETILQLHERIGLLLHARAANAEQSIAIIPQHECATVLVELLFELSRDAETAQRRADTLLRFSRDRLVLLRKIHDEGYSFGLRSFQEFAAARALLDGDAATVRERCLAVGAHSHWRNVLRLLASELARRQRTTDRAFAEQSLVGACVEMLNSAKTPETTYSAGAMARQILSEVDKAGAIWLSALIAKELNALARRNESLASRLFADDAEELARETIDYGPIQTSPARQHLSNLREWIAELATFYFHSQRFPTAWRLVRSLLLLESPNTQHLISQFAPQNPAQGREAITALGRGTYAFRTKHAVQKIFALHPLWYPLKLLLSLRLYPLLEEYREHVHQSWIRLFPGDSHLSAYFFRAINSEPISSFSISEEAQKEVTADPSWKRLRTWQTYEHTPSPEKLIDVLENCTEEQFNILEMIVAARLAHWSIESAIVWAGTHDRLRLVVEQLKQGKLGTITDWHAAEDRWKEPQQVSITELIEKDTSLEAPWSPEIAVSGIPLSFRYREGLPTDGFCALHTTQVTWTPLVFALWRAGILEASTDTSDFEQFLQSHPWYRKEADARFQEIYEENGPDEHDAPHYGTDFVPDPLFTQQEWKRLALPGRSPEEARALEAPVVLESIDELSGIRAFASRPKILGELPRPVNEEGQWIVLLGENGSGKTTLLRAIALALVEQNIGTKLLSHRLEILRNGHEGRIGVHVNGTHFECRIRRDASEEESVEVTKEDERRRPWIVAYGVRRGNALNEPSAAELRGTANLHTLFEHPSSLVHAPTWLSEKYKLVLAERDRNRREKLPDDFVGREERVWNEIVRALQVILRVTEIDAGGRSVMVTHPEFGRLRLSQLSDGYLTTAGWIIDLLARWIREQEAKGEMLPANILAAMTGIVLVDELDLHLHPVWQMRIIDDLRKHFPKLSFIVTTHNPLTVHGARRGEVFLLRREDQQIVLEQKDVRPGSDVDRVLFDLFGVYDTLDKETRAMIDRHTELLRQQVPSNHPERLRLETQLRGRLGLVGTSLLEQRDRENKKDVPLTEEEQKRAETWFGPSSTKKQ